MYNIYMYMYIYIYIKPCKKTQLEDDDVTVETADF